jgi:Tfp pilus assembly protein PilW
MKDRPVSGSMLVELMIGLVLSSMLLTMTGWLWLCNSRSFMDVSVGSNLEARDRDVPRLTSGNLRSTGQEVVLQRSRRGQWFVAANATRSKPLGSSSKLNPEAPVSKQTD